MVTLQSIFLLSSQNVGLLLKSEANRFLETEYRELFNQRFAVEPEAESIFVSAAKDLNLDSILCKAHEKTDANRDIFV